MRSTLIAVAALLLVIDASGRAQSRQRLNPVISLIEHNQPVFGVYWPSNGGGRRGGEPPPARPAADLAKDALGYTATDFLFSGSMEGGVDRGMPAYMEFVKALFDVTGAKITEIYTLPLLDALPRTTIGRSS